MSGPCASSSSSSTTTEEGTYTLVCKYGACSFPMVHPARCTVLEIKQALEALTNVSPARQKIIGLKKGKLMNDSDLLSELSLKQNQKFIMMGTPEDMMPQVIIQPEFSEDDEGYEENTANDDDIATSSANIERLRQKIEKTTITAINPPRPGKRLLVLDIDHTIFDCRSTSDSIAILKRPYLDTFLPLIYKYYDIAFWSQTSWKWVEAKLTEMGILGSDNEYKVVFVLDQSAMPRVEDRNYYNRKKDTGKNGECKYYEIKPLQLIFEKFPDYYHQHNTIHVDDLSRNFVMNHRNGLKISAYKNANTTHKTDRELLFLGYYLTMIKDTEDFTALDHSHWRDHVFELVNRPS
jgi:ubiquitin-like domain-containing CTD phosphatase 1